MKLDYEADYESLTEMLKQLQKTPAKTFDMIYISELDFQIRPPS